MPNIASVLKQEISRIARKETRSEIESVKKATVQHRRYIASLRQQVKLLERQVAALRSQKRSAALAEDGADQADGRQVRFVAKGLRSLRTRLDLSVSELARLIGVSGQTVYNWEAKITKPRSEQLKAIAQLRGMGRREARNRLQEQAEASA